MGQMRVGSLASVRSSTGRIVIKRRTGIESLLWGRRQGYSRLVLTEKLFRAKVIS